MQAISYVSFLMKPKQLRSLNSGSNQRFILVSATFRKEVTSTVLWLISKGIKAQCMQITPIIVDEAVLIDIRKLIPPPETEDYMIGMSLKDNEAQAETNTAKQKNQQIRLLFWEQMLDHFRKNNFGVFQSISAGKDSWLRATASVDKCAYSLTFNKSEVRVGVRVCCKSKKDTMRIFDLLDKHKEKIESQFGKALDWRRGEEIQASMIQYSKSCNSYNEENWPEIIQWLLEHMKMLETAFKPIFSEIPKQKAASS